jgi:hypothetical protein
MPETDDGLASPTSGPSYEELRARHAEALQLLHRVLSFPMDMFRNQTVLPMDMFRNQTVLSFPMDMFRNQTAPAFYFAQLVRTIDRFLLTEASFAHVERRPEGRGAQAASFAHVERRPEGRGAQAERGQQKTLTRVGTDWWVLSIEGDHYQIDCFTGPGAEQQAREFMANGVTVERVTVVE